MVLRAQWPLSTIAQFFHFVAEEKKKKRRQKTKAFMTGLPQDSCLAGYNFERLCAKGWQTAINQMRRAQRGLARGSEALSLKYRQHCNYSCKVLFAELSAIFESNKENWLIQFQSLLSDSLVQLASSNIVKTSDLSRKKISGGGKWGGSEILDWWDYWRNWISFNFVCSF